MMATNMKSSDKIDDTKPHPLLAWVNKKLKADFAKIEHLCTGAAYCQFMDMIYPGTVNMEKVVFYTDSKEDFFNNFTLFESIFKPMNMGKLVKVKELINENYKIQLTFLQWFKRFFDVNYDSEIHGLYSAHSARGNVRLGYGPAALCKVIQENVPMNPKDITRKEYIETFKKLSAEQEELEQKTSVYNWRFRQIEVLCELVPDSRLSRHVLSILYQTGRIVNDSYNLENLIVEESEEEENAEDQNPVE